MDEQDGIAVTVVGVAGLGFEMVLTGIVQKRDGDELTERIEVGFSEEIGELAARSGFDENRPLVAAVDIGVLSHSPCKWVQVN